MMCYTTSPGSTNAKPVDLQRLRMGRAGELSKVSNSFMYGKGSSLNVRSVNFFLSLF